MPKLTQQNEVQWTIFFIRNQGEDYKDKVYILIASETTHLILGTKVKIFNHIPTLPFFFPL